MYKKKYPLGVKQKLFLFMLSFAFIAVGLNNLYIKYKNSDVTEISISEFELKKPDAQWIKITGGYYDIENTFYKESKTTNLIKTLYIPYVSNVSDHNNVHILVETSNSEHVSFFSKALEIMDNLRANSERKGKDWYKARKEARKFINENDKWFNTVDIEGLIRTGIHRKGSEERKISAISDKLAADYVILELNGRPVTMSAILTSLFFGFLFLGYLVYREYFVGSN